MSETLTELRHPLAVCPLIARYDTAGFTEPTLLADMAQTLLRFIARHEAAVGELEEGMQFQFGWSVLTLQSWDDGLLVCEPDFSLDEPHTGLVDQVTLTLQVAVMQAWVNQRANMPARSCLFFEHLVVLEGALEVSDIVLVHGERTSPTHCGWQLTPRDPEVAGALADGQLYETPIWTLLGSRPHVLKALALPPGSIAVFQDDVLVLVRDEDNNVRCELDDPGPTWVLPEVEEAPAATGGWFDRFFRG